jgi:hypothetical protein
MIWLRFPFKSNWRWFESEGRKKKRPEEFFFALEECSQILPARWIFVYMWLLWASLVVYRNLCYVKSLQVKSMNVLFTLRLFTLLSKMSYLPQIRSTKQEIIGFLYIVCTGHKKTRLGTLQPPLNLQFY